MRSFQEPPIWHGLIIVPRNRGLPCLLATIGEKAAAEDGRPTRLHQQHV